MSHFWVRREGMGAYRVEIETTLSYASIMGIKTDINLTGDKFQWLGSMFYFGTLTLGGLNWLQGNLTRVRVGYLAWEYPTSRLLQLLPLAKYSSFCIIVWGLVLCCLAAVENFSAAVAVRFFLGVFEAAVTPGSALFTSQVGVAGVVIRIEVHCPNDM